jgi:hypothetical protein
MSGQFINKGNNPEGKLSLTNNNNSGKAVFSVTVEPLNFTTGFNCAPGAIDIIAGSVTGGVSLPFGNYYFGSTYFLTEVAALANTNWVTGTTLTYGVGPTNGTWWMVVKDVVGTVLAKSVTTTC